MNTLSKLTITVAAGVCCAASGLAGSLWNESTTNERGMFADKRARRVGDIVTIVVQENTVANNSLELKTAREAKAGNANPLVNVINQFISALPATILGKNRVTDEMTKSRVPGASLTVPPIEVGGTVEYKGGGDITNRQVVTSRVAVTVVDVLPNGNMVVEGVRLVRFSGETQYASLRGVLRPADVQKDNTVLSTNIADAQVEFVSEGSLSDAQKKGWLLRLTNKVSPF
ncbi:MAG: flagellar L-ring protein FlgH [Chthoniobacter sp.]|jgi:flagellar L-ring protein precursor FlgH|nr:flagellar L-ring protein FlgH [Chthoniobacter sp.]